MSATNIYLVLKNLLFALVWCKILNSQVSSVSGYKDRHSTCHVKLCQPHRLVSHKYLRNSNMNYFGVVSHEILIFFAWCRYCSKLNIPPKINCQPQILAKIQADLQRVSEMQHFGGLFTTTLMSWTPFSCFRHNVK